ncbi:uncharacterized protein METZ01_LOCUS355255, partial [marine metagenome]
SPLKQFMMTLTVGVSVIGSSQLNRNQFGWFRMTTTLPRHGSSRCFGVPWAAWHAHCHRWSRLIWRQWRQTHTIYFRRIDLVQESTLDNLVLFKHENIVMEPA